MAFAAIQASPKAFENWSRIVPQPQPRYGSFFEFSPDRNIFFYIADTISLDAARTVLAANPKLAEQFEGFHFYEDTLSAQDTTPATYAILTGRVLELSRGNDVARYRLDIAAEGFPRHLSDAGYALDYVVESEAHCAGLYTLCAVRNTTGSFPKSLLDRSYGSELAPRAEI